MYTYKIAIILSPLLPPPLSLSLKLTVSEQSACHFLCLSGAVGGSEVFLAPEEGSSLEGTNQLYEVTRGARTILNTVDTLYNIIVM